MKRRLLQLWFVIGLLLALAATVLFIRGFWATERVYFARSWKDGGDHVQEGVTLSANRFRFVFTWMRQSHGKRDDLEAPRFGTERDRSDAPSFTFVSTRSLDPFWERLGFGIRTTGGWTMRPHGTTGLTIMLPAWLIILISAGTTLWMYRSMRRQTLERRRLARGLCLTCGYDLRGAEHERCPECGAGVEMARV